MVNGCLCKANFPGDKEIKSFIRDENGLLTCIGKATLTPKYSQNDLETLKMAIKMAAENGQPFTHTGNKGLYALRSSLPDSLKNMSKTAFEEMGTELLQTGKIVKCIGGSGKTKQWLDVPEGPFAQGIGSFEAGSMEAKKSVSNLPKNIKNIFGNGVSVPVPNIPKTGTGTKLN